MAGAARVTVADACAKQPGDIGRVGNLGLVQVVVEVVARAVEEQADVQGLAAWRRLAKPRRQAQRIMVAPRLLALAQEVVLDLFDTLRQTPLQRKLRGIAHRLFYWGHDCGSGNCSGVLIGYSGLP